MQDDLQRFVRAQADSYDIALAELRAGAKQSHWMWFVFPQIAGLGHSAMAQRFAIRDLDEARRYLAHPVLGARYLESVSALMTHPDWTATQMLGTIDAMKLRSSLTLFDRAGAAPVVAEALAAFFGMPDQATLGLL